MKLNGDSAMGSYCGASGGIYGERTNRDWRRFTSWRALADNARLAGRGCCILYAVVLVTAVLAGFSCRHGWRGALALDCGPAVRAGFRGGAQVRLGFRMDGTWNAGADCSTAEAGGRGILPICAQPHVCGVFRGLVGVVGGLRAGGHGGNPSGARSRGGRSTLCTALRRTDAAKDVR